MGPSHSARMATSSVRYVQTKTRPTNVQAAGQKWISWEATRESALWQLSTSLSPWSWAFHASTQIVKCLHQKKKLKVMRNEKSKPRWPSRAWYSQPLAASSLLDVLGNSMTLIATGSSLSKNDDGGRKIDNNLKEGVNYNWGKVKMMSVVTKIYILHNCCTQLSNVFFLKS